MQFYKFYNIFNISSSNYGWIRRLVMNIIVDGMGGDNSPKAIVEGCAEAVKELGLNIIIVRK